MNGTWLRCLHRSMAVIPDRGGAKLFLSFNCTHSGNRPDDRATKASELPISQYASYPGGTDALSLRDVRRCHRYTLL